MGNYAARGRYAQGNRNVCARLGVNESEYTPDFKMCKCGAGGVDGGHAYLRRQGNPDDWEELSEITIRRDI